MTQVISITDKFETICSVTRDLNRKPWDDSGD